ncbi:MAG: phosphohydrolase, partial [Bacteroidetes bacterium]|nr:phosphohydrolase [Bacteroidota bacterium]
ADHAPDEIDEKDFMYPGPRPRSREEAIFMLADSLEASCKSLEQPSYDELVEMIDKIIDYKVKAGQLEDTDLSFKDLETVRKVFKKMLKSIHHVRVNYDEAGKQRTEN